MVVDQLVERSLTSPEIRGSNTITDIIAYFCTNCNEDKTKIKEKEAGNETSKVLKTASSFKKYKIKIFARKKIIEKVIRELFFGSKAASSAAFFENLSRNNFLLSLDRHRWLLLLFVKLLKDKPPFFVPLWNLKIFSHVGLIYHQRIRSSTLSPSLSLSLPPLCLHFYYPYQTLIFLYLWILSLFLCILTNLSPSLVFFPYHYTFSNDVSFASLSSSLSLVNPSFFSLSNSIFYLVFCSFSLSTFSFHVCFSLAPSLSFPYVFYHATSQYLYLFFNSLTA